MQDFLRQMGCEPKKRVDILRQLHTRLSSREEARAFADLGGVNWLKIYLRQHDIVLPCLLCLEAMGDCFNPIIAQSLQLIPVLLGFFEHPNSEISAKSNLLMNKLNELKRNAPFRDKLKISRSQNSNSSNDRTRPPSPLHLHNSSDEPPSKRSRLDERPRKVKFSLKNTTTIEFSRDSEPVYIFKVLQKEKRQKFQTEIPWRCPALLNTTIQFDRGQESEEITHQTRRVKSVLESIYPNNRGIPSSPREPPREMEEKETLSESIIIPFHPKRILVSHKDKKNDVQALQHTNSWEYDYTTTSPRNGRFGTMVL